MATAVGMNFKMTASIAKFQASMDKVEEKLKGIERSGKQTASGMKLLAGIEVGKLLVSGLTSVYRIIESGVSTVTQFASQAAAAADAIGKLSSSTGMAEEPLQVFTQLASYSGVSSTQFGDALQKMSRGLGEAANGTGTASRALEQLGLSVDDLLSMSPDQQFLKIGNAIGEIEDPAKRSSVAADIFGRSGTKLIPMFEDLEENARGTATEMLELGQVLSGTQVNNIEAMNDSFEKVRQTAFKIGSQVLANFAPAITEANASLIEMIKNFEYEGAKGGQGLANFLTQRFFDFAKTLAQALDKFLNGFNAVVGKLLEALGKLIQNVLPTIAAAGGAGDETVSEIEWVGRQLGIMGRALEGTTSNIEGFVDTAIDKFKPAVNEAADNLKGLTEQAAKATDPLLLFGENNGIAGEKLRELALHAEKYGANSDLATEALDGMRNAAERATPAAELFGENVGTSADELRQLAFAAENAKEIDSISDRLGPLADAANMSGDELQQLSTLVARTGGLHGDLGDELIELMRSTSALDDVQKSLQQSMMKPAEDFANQRAEMLRRMGFNPFFVEDQKQKWLAQQKEAVDKQVEIQREAYEKFKEKIGEGLGDNIKEALEAELDIESTLPELKTQSATLGNILTAIENKLQGAATFAIQG